MAADALQGTDLRWLAERVGTPFYVYDAAIGPGQNRMRSWP